MCVCACGVRSSLLFVSTASVVVALAYASFTLRVAEHVWFGWWVVVTVALGIALESARTVRRAPLSGRSVPGHHAKLQRAREAVAAADGSCPEVVENDNDNGGENGGGGGSGEGDGEGDDDDVFECALCGVAVRGYDHHCVWLDACVGAHNVDSFLIGLLALLCFSGVGGALAAQRVPSPPPPLLPRPTGSGSARLGGVAIGAVAASPELLLVVGAALTWLAIGALLVAQASGIARGVTGHEARRMRRRGERLPPCGGPATASARVWQALRGDPTWRRSYASEPRF